MLDVRCTMLRVHLASYIVHGAVIHGATIGRNVLVGMNSVVMDGADIGDNSIIGALSFVKGEMPLDRPKQAVLFETWQSLNSKKA